MKKFICFSVILLFLLIGFLLSQPPTQNSTPYIFSSSLLDTGPPLSSIYQIENPNFIFSSSFIEPINFKYLYKTVNPVDFPKHSRNCNILTDPGTDISSYSSNSLNLYNFPDNLMVNLNLKYPLTYKEKPSGFLDTIGGKDDNGFIITILKGQINIFLS